MSRLLLLICALSCLSSALVINSPEERIYYHQRGSFANFITNTTSLNATVVLADPIYACEPLKINATGKFVLAKRNDDLSPTQCTFATKVKNIENSGASLAIIMNSAPSFFEPDMIIGMGYGEEEAEMAKSINITAIFICYQDGSELVSFIQRNETTATFDSRGDVELGDTDLTSVTAMMAICMGIIILMFIVLWLMEKCTKNKALHNRKKAVNHIKTKTYSKVADPEKYESLCSVCQENFIPTDRIKILPCNHIFHADCIEKWLIDEKPICPNCRCPVVKEDPSLNTPQQLTPEELRRQQRRECILDLVIYCIILASYIIFLS